MTLASYQTALRGVPELALTAVVSEYVAGRLGDGEWVPTPARLRRSADHYAGQWKTELAFIDELLNAEIIPERRSTADERKAAADRVREQFGIVSRETPGAAA